MKRVYTLGLTGLLAATLLSGNVMANSLPEDLENDLIAVCKAIKSDNRLAIHRAVAKSRLSYRALHDGLVCNGEDMMTFAATSNAQASNDFLARKVRRDPRVLTAKR
ncbi:DUF3718 domain-containing protein [Alteromonas halophila]|uniref:DUF3718 domain-containing protein n=1 Tax=Alteromonas halophila TaxID=516698 RepID=A0A918JD17_9ALTE|nr:DUF3718 domain-containing protein [Alteromonas halophila]GGW72626.1 hypothetical protein GCM10007391_00090 [Alteromonas halophila]